MKKCELRTTKARAQSNRHILLKWLFISSVFGVWCYGAVSCVTLRAKLECMKTKTNQSAASFCTRTYCMLRRVYGTCTDHMMGAWPSHPYCHTCAHKSDCICTACIRVKHIVRGRRLHHLLRLRRAKTQRLVTWNQNICASFLSRRCILANVSMLAFFDTTLVS